MVIDFLPVEDLILLSRIFDNVASKLVDSEGESSENQSEGVHTDHENHLLGHIAISYLLQIIGIFSRKVCGGTLQSSM